jgi:hypothetical protein
MGFCLVDEIDEKEAEMAKNGRYSVSGLIEAQYQPGSRNRVLRNLLSITRKRVMDEAEAREQKRALKITGLWRKFLPV